MTAPDNASLAARLTAEAAAHKRFGFNTKAQLLNDAADALEQLTHDLADAERMARLGNASTQQLRDALKRANAADHARQRRDIDAEADHLIAQAEADQLRAALLKAEGERSLHARVSLHNEQEWERRVAEARRERDELTRLLQAEVHRANTLMAERDEALADAATGRVLAANGLREVLGERDAANAQVAWYKRATCAHGHLLVEHLPRWLSDEISTAKLGELCGYTVAELLPLRNALYAQRDAAVGKP